MPGKKVKKKKKAFLSFPIVFFLLLVLLACVGLFIPKIKAYVLTCANAESCVGDLSGIPDDQKKVAIFMGKTIEIPQSVYTDYQYKPVLGVSDLPKKIFIDLAAQRLYAYEGDNLIYSFLVSTGKWGKTPTGAFSIWVKLRYTNMVGGNRSLGTYYNLPNVPYTMFFYNDEVPKAKGYGIHGTYWHDNFGHPMSHGCINMRTEEVAQLYEWAHPPAIARTTYASDDNPGTPVIIYGTAPSE